MKLVELPPRQDAVGAQPDQIRHVLGDQPAVAGNELDRNAQRGQVRDRVRHTLLRPIEKGQEAHERQVVFILAAV